MQITALEDNNDEHDAEGEEEGKEENETDICNQLDKAAKLSALKVQVSLTVEDIEAVWQWDYQINITMSIYTLYTHIQTYIPCILYIVTASYITYTTN